MDKSFAKSVHVVIVGAGARDAAFKHPASNGQTPSLEIIMRSKEICAEYENNFELHLIDPRYSMHYYPPLRSFSEGMQKEYTLLENLDAIGVNIVQNIYKRWDTKETSQLKEFSQSPNSSNPNDVIFISYVGATDEYDFMAFLDIAKTKGHYFVTGLPLDEKCPVDGILESYYNGNLKEMYEVFSGEIVDREKCTYIPRLVNTLMLEGAIMVRNHIIAGLFDPKSELPDINVTIPNWSYQIETPFIKGIIGYYGIKNIDVSDRTNEKELRSSAQSRKTFFRTASKVICNYVYKNSLITDEDFQSISSWETKETYDMIIDRLRNTL